MRASSPDFVRYFVKQLKVLLPMMGKARIAQVLARAGLHLGVTTVGRMLRETEPIPEDAATLAVIDTRAVTARHPDEVWHVDLTTVPTGPSFWVPWVPFVLPQSWPFCWWVAVGSLRRPSAGEHQTEIRTSQELASQRFLCLTPRSGTKRRSKAHYGF